MYTQFFFNNTYTIFDQQLGVYTCGSPTAHVDIHHLIQETRGSKDFGTCGDPETKP